MDECEVEWWEWVAIIAFDIGMLAAGFVTGLAIVIALAGNPILGPFLGSIVLNAFVFGIIVPVTFETLTCESIADTTDLFRNAQLGLQQAINEDQAELTHALAMRDILIARINALQHELEAITQSNAARLLDAKTLDLIQTQYNGIRQSLLTRAQAAPARGHPSLSGLRLLPARRPHEESAGQGAKLLREHRPGKHLGHRVAARPVDRLLQAHRRADPLPVRSAVRRQPEAHRRKKRYTRRRETIAAPVRQMLAEEGKTVDFSGTFAFRAPVHRLEAPGIERKIVNVGFVVKPQQEPHLDGVAELDVSFDNAAPIHVATNEAGILATATENPAGTGLAELEAMAHGKSMERLWSIKITALPGGLTADAIDDVFLLLNFEYAT